MSSSPPKRRGHIGGFSPLNTLSSQVPASIPPPLQETSGNAAMPREINPPRASSPSKTLNVVSYPAIERPQAQSRPQQAQMQSNASQSLPPPGSHSRPVQQSSAPSESLSSSSSTSEPQRILVEQLIASGVGPYKQQQQQQQQQQQPFVAKSRPPFPSKAPANVFNVPPAGKPRPEHHRNVSSGGWPAATHRKGPQPQQQGSYSSLASVDSLMAEYGAPRLPNAFKVPPSIADASSTSAYPPQIPPGHTLMPQPVNMAPRSIPAAPRQMFSTADFGGFKPVNAQSNYVDLTQPYQRQDPNDGFVPDRALGDNQFGTHDPFMYMDAAQTSENIKQLLEGALDEDEDDKPKTRLRRRKGQGSESNGKHATDTLADSMKGLKVSADKDASAQVSAEPDEADQAEDDGTVEGLSVRLLPHQIDGVAWMMDKEIGDRKKNGVLPKGGILADDMGLGKTIQAIALILSNPRPSNEAVAKLPKRNKFPDTTGKGTLIVAPLALIKQWESEIAQKVAAEQKLKVLVHHGQTRTKHFADLKKYDIVITTYQTLTSEHEGSSPEENGIKVGCFGIQWYRVILDEAHSIKNRNAKMTKAAYALDSVYRWCLTGTPMQNNLDELQSLIRFLRIKPYMDLRAWKDQIGGPMKNGRGGLAMKRLQYFLKAFMKRRTKDVLKKEGGLTFGKQDSTKEGKAGATEGFHIVKRDVKTVVATFSDGEREFYDRFEARTGQHMENIMKSSKGGGYMDALVMLLRLRQICNHPELVQGSLKKERESLGTGGDPSASNGGQTGDGADDLAAMFSGLSVETKKCDMCQVPLKAERATEGAIRCSECEADLSVQFVLEKPRQKSKEEKKSKQKRSDRRRMRATRRVIEDDEDDDEGEGEWLVPNDQTHTNQLGKQHAPGSIDDEDAEGGGEWLDSSGVSRTEDEDTESEDENATAESTRKVVRSLRSKASTSTKIERLLQILASEAAEHKFIVFSEFTSMLDLVAPALTAANHHYVRYDGSMRNDARESALEALRTDTSVRVLLCSLRCGALGLNLTAASRVVLLEPFWNPFVEEQAVDRVHRLNQTRDVVVYRLTVAGTVEERILALQEKKRALARAAIEGGRAVGKLSMQDVLALFRRDAVDRDGPNAPEIGRPRESGGGMAKEETWTKPRVLHPGQESRARRSQFDPAYGRR